MLGKQHGSAGTVNLPKAEGNQEVKNSKGIAACFNEFFVSIGAKLSEKFSGRNTQHFPKEKRTTDKLVLQPIQQSFAQKELSKLSIAKATGMEWIRSALGY